MHIYMTTVFYKHQFQNFIYIETLEPYCTLECLGGYAQHNSHSTAIGYKMLQGCYNCMKCESEKIFKVYFAFGFCKKNATLQPMEALVF